MHLVYCLLDPDKQIRSTPVNMVALSRRNYDRIAVSEDSVIKS